MVVVVFLFAHVRDTGYTDSTVNTITPAQIVEWFRAKAAEFTAVADSLEQTFSDGKPSPKVLLGPKTSAPKTQHSGLLDPAREQEIVEWLKLELGGFSARAAVLATKREFTREEIRMVIQRHPDIFEVGEKGWVRLKQKEASQ